MKYTTIILLSILCISVAERHAIIVGPQDDWDDYGIQSESCRMYKDLVAGGVKPENIILMSTHEVPDAPENPFPGQLFTDDSPDAPGKDYAHGCIEFIDYEAEFMSGSVLTAIMKANVTKLKDITGKENPKVLRSTEEDEVMMYITTHGSDGRISIGGGPVPAKSFISALQYMYDNKMYKHFLFLLEACYAGSIFQKLPPGINVYAITSADNKHESEESHCPPDDVVDGKPLNTCLSCYWDNSMEWFMEGGAEHTLDELYEHTHAKVAEVSDQNVSRYGDIEEMGKMTLRDFMGDLPANRLVSKMHKVTSTVPKSKVPAHLAKWRAIRADKSNYDEAMNSYKKIVYENAKREIEVMRLGAALMNEKAANKAFTTSIDTYSPSCVSDLAESLVSKCGHSYPMSENVMNMLKNICLPGMDVANLDFSEICF